MAGLPDVVKQLVDNIKWTSELGNTFLAQQSGVMDAVQRMLDLFPELASARKQPAGRLSGGQQQMLALARVLIHDPEILMIDELSLGLAPVIVGELLEIVARIHESGVTLVLVHGLLQRE